MEFVNGLFVYSFTAFLLSFLVAKLISLAISSGEVGAGKYSCPGSVGEGDLEKRLKVEGLKSWKKTKKEPAFAETVLVSEFNREKEPDFAADGSCDDREELGTGEKNLEFLVAEVSETSADQLLSVGEAGGLEPSVTQKLEDCFGVDGPGESEGLLSSSEITLIERAVEEECKEVGCPIEGFEKEINSGNDLVKLVDYDQSADYKEDGVVGEETERCDFYHREEEVGTVGHGDHELVNDAIHSERREVYEQDEGRERKEPNIDDAIDAGLLIGENVVAYQHEHHMILDSLETESKVHIQEAYAGKADDQNEELRCLVSTEDVVDDQNEELSSLVSTEDVVDDQNEELRPLLSTEDVVDDQNEELRPLLSTEDVVDDQNEELGSLVSTEDVADDQNEELRPLVSTEDVVNRDGGRIDDEGTERSEPKIDDIIDVGFLGGDNVVDDQHTHYMILQSLETELKLVAHDGYVDQADYQNEEIRDEEIRIGEEGKGEMEFSDGEEWEGIERNELEREFAKALSFVECGNKEGRLSTLGSDVIKQFYGLQKVSMEGPCHEPPPMALKLSARAKWNAWQKLGNMTPEEAMEKYVNLLTDKVPGWMAEHPSVEVKLSSEVDGPCGSSDETLTPPLTCTGESKPGEEPAMRAGDLTGYSYAFNKDEE